MLYFDNTRLTSDRLHELIKFCEHKRLPETIILCEGSTVFAHIQGYHVKVVSRSTGIRTISASDFNDIVLKMGKTEFKHGLQAYHDTKQEKLISYAKSGVEPVIRAKNGRKYQQVKWKPKEATGELNLFAKLWSEREHNCTRCGKYLQEFNVSFFHHEKLKSTHPELRLEPSNISLTCFDCHFFIHNGFKK